MIARQRDMTRQPIRCMVGLIHCKTKLPEWIKTGHGYAHSLLIKIIGGEEMKMGNNYKPYSLISEHINKSGDAIVFFDDDGRVVKMTIEDMRKLRKENERWRTTIANGNDLPF